MHGEPVGTRPVDMDQTAYRRCQQSGTSTTSEERSWVTGGLVTGGCGDHRHGGCRSGRHAFEIGAHDPPAGGRSR